MASTSQRSQRSQSKRSQPRGTRDRDTIDEDVMDLNEWSVFKENLLKFILNNSMNKVPIKKSEMILHALNGNQKKLPQVLNHVKNDLNDIYGIDILEVPDTKSAKTYITVSRIPGISTKNFTPEQNVRILLLFLILSYIFMKGFPVNEGTVFQYLSKLRISIDSDHEFFGSNLKKLITDTFVKQLYLKREKVETVGAAEDEYVLSWGFRSYSEFPRKLVLEEVAKILHKPTACFYQQHSEVYGENSNSDDQNINPDE